MTWVLDLVRQLLSVFDRIVYGLIEVFYTAFNLIAKTRVIQPDIVDQFATRVYVFLALIMLFKLSFSIITYIINPDNFTNNEKGIGKLIQNVIIVMVLIVATPRIFEQAYNLQRIVLEENVIGKIILGSNTEIVDEESIYKTMSFSVLSAFLKPNTKEIGTLSLDDYGNVMCNGSPMPTIEEINANFDIDDQGGINDNLPFVKCMNNLSTQQATVIDDNGISHQGTGMGATYVWANYKQDYQLLINLITAKYVGDTSIYLFQYTYLISTIAGGFIAWIFLIFCFDIAVRSVKLSFLQLIAPIPIISYVDPKSSKGGMFQKWTKTCLSTYVDLFIRLVAIYFAIYIIKMISDTNQIYYVYGDGSPNAIIYVFIVVGALMFAKQVPKLIEDITGIKLSGKFELNPLKKIGESPFAAAAIGGIGAMAGGAAANLYNGIREGRGMRSTIGSTIGGATSGFFRGIHAGATGRGKDNVLRAAGHGLKGTVDARNLRASRQLAGDGGPGGVLRRAGVGINNLAGIESGASKFDKQVDAYDKFLKEQSDLDTYVEKELIKGKGGRSVSGEWTDVDGNTHSFNNLNVNVLKNRVDALRESGTASAEDITNADYLYHAALNQAKRDYIDDNSKSDATIKSIISNMNYIKNQNANLDGFSSMSDIVDGDDWDAAKGTIKKTRADVVSSDAYRQAQINRKNDSNKPPHGGGGRPH